MTWQKLGRIFMPDGKLEWMASHASVPFTGILNNKVIRIYFSSRNTENKSFVSALDFDLEKLSIIKVSNKPLFEPGVVGAFDQDGVMGCHLFENQGRQFLFYIGWNVGGSVPFRNAIGISELIGDHFVRIFNGPVLDRNIYDPCFVASNDVIKIQNEYLMFYLSCFEWKQVNNKLTHFYNIKIATSHDGLKWQPTGKVAIDFAHPKEYAISVPRVILEGNIYKMWYSFRGSENADTYRIGYAESENGFDWNRMDSEAGIDVSESGWDSEMICYPFIFDFDNKKYMLYNGNDYGRTGFGLARLL